MAYQQIPPVGQATMAASLPVAIASNQSAVPVTGPGGTILLGAVTSNSPISTTNSSTATLGISAVFTGTSEEVKDYAIVQVSVFANQASATNGLSLQQSSDGTNWDITDAYTVAASTGMTISVQPAARFFRIVYTNGGSAQASFRLQTVYHYNLAKSSSQRPADAQSNEIDLEQQQAFLMGYNGTTWDRLRVSATGILQTILTAGAATIGSIASITTSVVPGVAATNLGKAEDAGHTTGDTGVFVLAVRNDTPTALATTTLDYIPLTTDSLGATWTRSTGELSDDSIFTPGTSRVFPIGHTADEVGTDSVDEGDIGAPRMTLDRKSIVNIQAHVRGGATSFMIVSAASTNGTLVVGSVAQIYMATASSATSVVRYLKLYNKASSPTVGTDTPVYTFAIPGNTAGAGTNIPVPTVGLEFPLGIAMAVTAFPAITDTTSIGLNDVVVNLAYKS